MDPKSYSTDTEVDQLDREKQLAKYDLFPMYPTGQLRLPAPLLSLFLLTQFHSFSQVSFSLRMSFWRSKVTRPTFNPTSTLLPRVEAGVLGGARSVSPAVSRTRILRRIRLAKLRLRVVRLRSSPLRSLGGFRRWSRRCRGCSPEWCLLGFVRPQAWTGWELEHALWFYLFFMC